MDWHRDGYVISREFSRLDRDWLLNRLLGTYWARQQTPQTLWDSFEQSRCYGLYEEGSGRQVGFARAVTDGARFAWISDVFVDPSQRGRALGKWLMQTITEDPELQRIHLWMLATDDAHGLYEQSGFQRLDEADHAVFMRKRGPKS